MTARRTAAVAWVAVLSAVLVPATGTRGADPPEPGSGRPPVPDPPRQGQPWAPPETGLPKFLVRATALLFDQGLPDPRGCEFRTLDLVTTEVPMFVLPETPDDPHRYAISSDATLIDAKSVWGRADLDAYVRTLSEERKAARESGTEVVAGGRSGPAGVALRIVPAAARPRPSALMTVCLLLRFGRADLAEELFAATTGWSPGGPARDVTDYGVSYLTLAQDWADTTYLQVLEAHQSGDDAFALAALRRLDRLSRAAAATSRAMGVPYPTSNGRVQDATYFPKLRQLDRLLADQERRAKDPVKGKVPVPPEGGDPAARVAALVRNLDQIAERQNAIPGGVTPARSEGARELVLEGDAAVPALLDAVESDERLTRTVGRAYSFGAPEGAYVVPVHEVAADLLYETLKAELGPGQVQPGVAKNPGVVSRRTPVRDPSLSRKALAAKLRAAWVRKRQAKAGGVSPSAP